MEQRVSKRTPRPVAGSRGEIKTVHVGPSGQRQFWKNGVPPRYRVWGKHARRDGLFFASPSEAVAFYAPYGITVVEEGEA